MNLTCKLHFFRRKIRHWQRDIFGIARKIKLMLLSKINSLEATKESRTLIATESSDLSASKSNRQSILLEEEMMWKQRSMDKWIKEDDFNTSYFHRVVNGRREEISFSPFALMGKLLRIMVVSWRVFPLSTRNFFHSGICSSLNVAGTL